MTKKENKVVRVLWLSRHAATEEQRKELERIFGTVHIIFRSETVPNGKRVVEIMDEQDIDELVAVLPVNILAELLRLGIQPIRAVMERELLDDGNAVFHFKHFERLREVKIETEKL